MMWVIKVILKVLTPYNEVLKRIVYIVDSIIIFLFLLLYNLLWLMSSCWFPPGFLWKYSVAMII